MLLEGLEQVELRVLLNLHIEVVQGTDGCVAGQEVVGTRTEADNLQVLQTHNGTGNGHKLMNHLGTLGCIAHGLFGYIGTGLAQREGLAGIEHAAVSIATAVDQVLLCLLGGSAEHGGTLEPVGYHGL